jgi:hypothetical protein
MYRRFQNRFGTAGVIVAVVALVAALSGTALAASGALTGKQKKEVEKIAKKYAGKPGAPGAAGTNGTNGTNGKDGAPGAAGKDGTNGKDGTGTPGKSVTVTAATGVHCPEVGGATVKQEGASTGIDVCNGEKGPPGTPGAAGPKGDPWTAGGTLPVGATETGTWAFNATTEDTEVVAPISFAIPLTSEVEEENVHVGKENFSPSCPGSVTDPKAASGHLCIYYGEPGKPTNAALEFVTDPSLSFFGAGPAGAMMHFSVTGSAHGYGTWAVTG